VRELGGGDGGKLATRVPRQYSEQQTPMTFVSPMLCFASRESGPGSDRRYIAKPKLDGQRSQVHIRDGRTVACYSRPGRDLLRHPGMGWLRAMARTGCRARRRSLRRRWS